MLDITTAEFIGRGLHRECYRHPHNPNLCLKITYSGDSQESERESKYYNFLERRNIDWRLLPRCHGQVQTNRGQALVFDIIRDYDGEVSKPLDHYLGDKALFSRYRASLGKALEGLKTYLLEQRIVTMTIKPKNILLKRLNETECALYIVDNIGNSDLIPICNYVSALAVRKVLRKWRRFTADLLKQFPETVAELSASVFRSPDPGLGAER